MGIKVLMEYCSDEGKVVMVINPHCKKIIMNGFYGTGNSFLPFRYAT